MNTSPRKNFHVVVNGERIASFLLVTDATFFAAAAYDARLFGDARPVVEDHRGHMHEYASKSSPLS